MKTERLGVLSAEWPKAIDMECKKNCLTRFIQQMSMNSLAEGICGICNVRCSKHNLRCIPLDKVPSIELLRIHEDLYDTITGIHRMNNMNLKNNANLSQAFVLRTANDAAGYHFLYINT